MDWLYAIAGILLAIALAFLLGWTQTHVKSTATKSLIWIGAIILLLLVRFFDGQPFVFVAMALLALLDGIKHLPNWVGYAAVALAIGYVLRCGLIVIAENIDGIAREVERTNARMQLMESSLRDKLDDIASRLPETDSPEEPDYLKELRKQTLRD